jgi:acetyltransferase-like isoleucine patch superfamily enzyme
MEDKIMAKLLNKNLFLLMCILLVSIMSSSNWSCGGSSNNNNKTKINGTVLDVIGGSVSDIKVTVYNTNDKKLDSTKTNQLGQFTLKFKPNTDMVKIQFEVSNTTLSRFIAVTKDSNVLFNVTLTVSPGNITINDWTVFQDPVRISNSDELTFDSLEADFEIDGNGNTFIRAQVNSIVKITERSITISDCDDGINTQDSGFIMLEADEDITISANKNAISTSNDSFVRVTQTITPVDNNIFITSLKGYGIKSAGSSQVEINPQNTCSISGTKSATSQSGTSSIDPDGCTLIDG